MASDYIKISRDEFRELQDEILMFMFDKYQEDSLELEGASEALNKLDLIMSNFTAKAIHGRLNNVNNS